MTTRDDRTFVSWLVSQSETVPEMADPVLCKVATAIAHLRGQERIAGCTTELFGLNGDGAGTWARIQAAMQERETPTPVIPPRESPESEETLPPLCWRPLPEYAQISPELGEGACPWLDKYAEFSRLWSPRSFDGFHEAVGLWVLSTIAARRVLCHYGHERYTNLYALLCGRTTVHAKSSAVGIGAQVLRVAGLDFLLAADESTPASFVKSLANKGLSSNFDDLGQELQDEELARLAFAGQRGWYYEEFGSGLASMMRTDGIMADFRGLLRRFDDCPPTYERATIARGREQVDNPYLALIANLTPADLKPVAKRGTSLWGDGFLARFTLITPPQDEILRGQYPKGERKIPPELVTPLVAWHKRLGEPDVQPIERPDSEGEPMSAKAEVGPLPQTVIELPDSVFDAATRYLDGLMDLAEESTIQDLDGNLGRFPEKAMRVALLFASLEGSDSITMRHWARAQEIAERWRLYTFRAYEQVTALDVSEQREQEDQVLQIIQRHRKPSKGMTAAQIGRYIRGLGSSEVTAICDRLTEADILTKTNDRRTVYYDLPTKPEQ